jgi:hypothetical protein
LCALNDKIHVVDLAKAFDCVSHDILLLKLTFYRIQGKAGTVVSIILTMTTLKIPFFIFAGLNKWFNPINSF